MAQIAAPCEALKRILCNRFNTIAFEVCCALGIALMPPLSSRVVLAQPAPPVQQLVFRPYHASDLYNVGDTVGWIVSPGPTAPTYAYKWTIRRNNKDVLREGKLDLSSGQDKIEIVADQPEMIYVAIEPYADLNEGVTKDQGASATSSDGSVPMHKFVGGNTGRNSGLYAVGAAVAPRKLGLS